MFTWTTKSGIPKIPKRVRASRLTFRNNTSNMNVSVGKVKIGSGQYGNVNMYYTNNRMKNRVAVKSQDESMATEIALMKKIGRFAAVPKVRSGPNSRKLYTEYIPGNSLFNFLNENESFIRDEDVSLFAIQVIRQLQKIHSMDPSFRHNDLHTGNILVDDRANKGWNLNETGTKLFITDFGLARDSQYHNPIFENTKDVNYARSLKQDYGIYVGNHHMYDAAVFLISLKRSIKKSNCPNTYARILFITKGLKLVNDRPAPGQELGYSFRDIIKIFGGVVKNKFSPASPNIKNLFKTPRMSLENFARGKSLANLAKTNLNTYLKMLPNSMNHNKKIEYIVKTLKFKPRQIKKTPQKLKSFHSPQKLKSHTNIAPSRLKTFNIKRASPKRKGSPFNPRKFNNANYKVLRPVNIEKYFNSKGRLSNAKSFIETLVRTKRSEAWEKAKKMLENEAQVTRR